ncbi:diphthine methyltransferase homolog [Punica granatum]|uniref:methylated diphthine methylhydrolase n=1 Tax=Punica granatum TaxID=22663 RepID=A0A218X8B8_PUNGR|nr:diphthine methyltransferase homolog [Punica granatum]XP_031373280.1 diphthine methyltransferase homolog [Punica granatum]XP_031374069.1 diphthine methyltransferase homolog [Punica granatum]OWM81455.1 hypothetical protein CDL15_Pgr007493 [Punica granatum]
MDIAHCYMDGNTDAVEFCPHDDYHHVLATSTYTLLEGDNPSRSGSVSLFNVNADSSHLELFHRVEVPGIFDIKWDPVGSDTGVRPLLAQADSDGCIRVHCLERSSDEAEDKGVVLREISSEKISSSMCLCADWNPSATSISVGLSDGSISVISFSESRFEVLQEWKAHDFETWAASFDPHQPHLVYSGSDDCKFICWDIRDGPSNSVFRNSKAHMMGICCIMKSNSNPNILFTGSYDESFRIWDVRSVSRPVNVAAIGLGGGVWRIKNHPSVPGLVLTACMHNGFAIVKTRGEEIEVMETYKKHESLAYGADWQRGMPGESGRKTSVIATCSFYDRLVRIWTPESDIFA